MKKAHLLAPALVALTLQFALHVPPVQARLFPKTFGSTVPGTNGEGCTWNSNQDYFVPRYCDSGRYGLTSPCAESHYRSPACRLAHPLYAGYCTPYGCMRSAWRDHVYEKACGCGGAGCPRGSCAAPAWEAPAPCASTLCLPASRLHECCREVYVEPLGGDSLGVVTLRAIGGIGGGAGFGGLGGSGSGGVGVGPGLANPASGPGLPLPTLGGGLGLTLPLSP